MTQPITPALVPPVSTTTPPAPTRKPWASEWAAKMTADPKPAAPITPAATMGGAAKGALADALVAAVSSGVLAASAARGKAIDGWTSVAAFATHVLAAPVAPRVSRAARVVMLMGVGSMIWRRVYDPPKPATTGPK